MAEMTNEEFFKKVIDMDFMEFIKTDEDFRENTYTLGGQTLIGYGFAYIYRGEMNTADMEKWVRLKKNRPLDGVRNNDGPMNRGVADEWFLFLMRYEFYPQLVHFLTKGESVIKDVMKDLTKGQRSALLDLFYNSGSGNFTESEIYKRVKKNPNDPALPGIIESYNLKYPGLIDRRKVTAHLYATDEVKTDINVSYKHNNEQNSYSLNEIRYINTNHCNAIKCNDDTQTSGDTQSNGGSDVMNKSKINGKICKIRMINELLELTNNLGNTYVKIENSTTDGLNEYERESIIKVDYGGESNNVGRIIFKFNPKGYYNADIKILKNTNNFNKLSEVYQKAINDIFNKKYTEDITDTDIQKFENNFVLIHINRFFKKCTEEQILVTNASNTDLCNYKSAINEGKIDDIKTSMIRNGRKFVCVNDSCNIDNIEDKYNINNDSILIVRMMKDKTSIINIFKYTYSIDDDGKINNIDSISQIFVEPTSNK
jgi:GH24 family phage-related lysozyme (muramidase)